MDPHRAITQAAQATNIVVAEAVMEDKVVITAAMMLTLKFLVMILAGIQLNPDGSELCSVVVIVKYLTVK